LSQSSGGDDEQQQEAHGEIVAENPLGGRGCGAGLRATKDGTRIRVIAGWFA
jgi:hypothetical protein